MREDERQTTQLSIIRSRVGQWGQAPLVYHRHYMEVNIYFIPLKWVEAYLYSSMTVALEGGEWWAARPGRTLPPGKTRYPFYRRLVGPQGRSGRAENLVPTGIRSRIVQPVVSRYTDWATRATNIYFTPLNGKNPGVHQREVWVTRPTTDTDDKVKVNLPCPGCEDVQGSWNVAPVILNSTLDRSGWSTSPSAAVPTE